MYVHMYVRMYVRMYMLGVYTNTYSLHTFNLHKLYIIRTYVSFKHGRLLHTYTRFFTWTRAFFAKKRTTGYVRTTGTGTGVKHSVFYELYRTYNI